MTSGRMTMAGTLWRCVACRFHRWLTARSISVTRTRNGEVTSFQATETRPWSPATSSMSRGCFPASSATRALRPGNLVYKIIKWERQRQRDRLVWLPTSS